MTAADERGLRSPSKERSSLSFPPGYSLRGCIVFFITFLFVLVVLQDQVTKWPLVFPPSSSPSPWNVLHKWEQALRADGGDCARRLDDATSRLRDTVTFRPLKDPRLLENSMEGTTWFMSSLNDTYEGEDSQHLRFPSAASRGRLLCVAGNHSWDGTKNSYALAWRDALPLGAALLPGLTFVSDTYYDYQNPWHGLEALLPFFGWHLSRGCALPERWVLYLRGQLRTSAEMGCWARTLTEVALGQELRLEDFADGGGRPSCFEEAVVFRHNEGVVSTKKKVEVYDMLRFKARAFCNVTSEEDANQKGGAPHIRLTLLLRTGARSFKNESAVIDIFRSACSKFEGCRFTVAWANQLETFCDQVRTLSATDVLVSPHGAQLSNMLFMDRNSSVMEFFPRGWLELAGEGQYVYHWLARDAGMRHRGAWRDPVGVPCPFPEEDFRCFTDYFKDQRLGHDEGHFARWTSAVLGQVREAKVREAAAGAGCGSQSS